MFAMNIKKLRLSNSIVFILVLVSALLSACKENSSKDNSANQGVTRILNDSPINGVNYQCDGKTSLTKNGGEFTCLNAPVTFSIGGLILGEITTFHSDKQVFPQDLSSVERTNFSDTKTIKLARFLQSIDDDGDISQAIDIPYSVAGMFLTNSNINDFTLDQLADMTSIDLVTTPFAISHLRRSINGGDDRSDYVIRVDISDANSNNMLATDVSLFIKGAEVLNSKKVATNNINLDGLSKVTTLYLKNTPEDKQDIKVIIKAEGYIDSGVSITLSEAVKFYDLNLSLVKDDEGVIANGIFASEMSVLSKINNEGNVTEEIILENKESANKPGVKLTIPVGTVLTDKNGNPVIGAKLKITSFDPYQSDAIAAYPGGLNVIAEASGFNIGGSPQIGETAISFKSAGFAAISITDEDGNKVKNFSNDIEVAMQFAIGTKDGDGNVVAIGDAVPIWSYDEESGKWSYEKEGTVQDLDLADDLYDVTYSLNHLSYWNIDWDFSNSCDHSRTFFLKDSFDIKLPASEFSFYLVIDSSPSVARWLLLPSINQENFFGFTLVPANTSGVVEIWTRDKSTLLASQSFNNICEGADFDMVFEYDIEGYDYDAAIVVLDALDAANDKSVGVKPISNDINFALNIAASLNAQDDARGEELLLRIKATVLAYSGAFIESEGYQGVTPNIYGCDANQINFVKELIDNFYYQDVFNGPLAGNVGAEVLPYLITAANVFAEHGPTELAYAPYGIRAFITCGFDIAELLASLGDESDHAAIIYDHFEEVVIFTVASMKLDIESELASNDKISYSSAATFLYIIDQAISIAEELTASTGFSSDSLEALNAAKAYYDELEATGKIGEVLITD